MSHGVVQQQTTTLLRPFHRACFSVQLPLVGGEAPDFTAEAVFDQEFQTVTLSQYRVTPAP